MARYRGTFTAAANYEPLKAAPFDSRTLVETKNDLISDETWIHENGVAWTYTGMLVVVASDINPDNNGLYTLINEDYTQFSNWRKTADERDIARILEEIENLEVSGGSLDIEVETEAELPETGDNNTTYYVKENNSIQRWDDETQEYETYGGVGESPELEINLIHGGNANGTD